MVRVLTDWLNYLNLKHGLDDQYFTAEQISSILLKRKIKSKPNRVALSLRKAGDLIDKKSEKKIRGMWIPSFCHRS